ncbi:hypothetical protein EAF00_007261 [Botryotinia globosa]|nr:hypothetical protein EAF00_007261 [Botryotinia globosa]
MREAFYAEYYADVQGPTAKIHVGKFITAELSLIHGETNMRIDHCIDDIRQALMCHADTSITTFEWEGIRRSMPNFSGYVSFHNQSTINFLSFPFIPILRLAEIVGTHVTARAFSMFDQVSLINPTYGIAFPMVNEEIDYTPPDQEGCRALWPKDLGGRAHG